MADEQGHHLAHKPPMDQKSLLAHHRFRICRRICGERQTRRAILLSAMDRRRRTIQHPKSCVPDGQPDLFHTHLSFFGPRRAMSIT